LTRFMPLLLAVVLAVAIGAPTAAAHVHGVTPLNVCTVDDPNSGGLRADDEDNPITGFIPTAVGNAERGNVPTAGGGPAETRVQCP
jgi:hypothetical protein